MGLEGDAKMKVEVLVLCLFAVVLVSSCRTNQSEVKESRKAPVMDEALAIRIATEDLLKEHQAVDKYNSKAVEETKTWRVEFQLKDRTTMGGGIIYSVDKESGKIAKRQYCQ
jgi:hypothetical protein